MVEVVSFDESDIGVLLIRCLESELYAAIVALSIIPVGVISSTWFDVSCAATFPLLRTREKSGSSAIRKKNWGRRHSKLYPLAGVAYQASVDLAL
jgi:hypothetical protein